MPEFQELVGGILNSLLWAAIGLPSEFLQTRSFNENNITLVDGRVGQIHNLIIQDMLRDDPMLLEKEMNSYKLTLIIQQKMRAYGYQISVGNNSRIINVLEPIKPKDFSNPIEETIMIYKKAAPEQAKEIDVIYNFASHTVQLSDEEALTKYSNGYINIVKESNISSASKETITASVAVAANCSLLWANK